MLIVKNLLFYFFAGLTVCGCVVIFFVLRKKHTYWKRKKVPQLNPHFLFGDQYKAWTGECSKTELFLEIYRKFKNQKVKFGGFYMMWKKYFMPIDPIIIKDILGNSFQNFTDHGLYHHQKDILFENVFTLEGKRWSTLRKKLRPVFKTANIRTIFYLLANKAEIFYKILDANYVNTKPLNINKLLENLVNSTYGLEPNILENAETGEGFGSYIFNPRKYWTSFEQFIPWSVLGYFGHKASNGKELERRFLNRFNDYMQKKGENNGVHAKNFMDLFLAEMEENKNNFKLSKDEIISHSFLFLASGFETSATTMTFVIYDLAINEDIQNKLRNEVKQVFKQYGENLWWEAINKMYYLDQVVKESLRHHPPFARIARICTKDYTIPGTDITITKGTKTIIPMWGLHMDAEYFHDPIKYNPEHFNKENEKRRPSCTYMPFGEGKRTCLDLQSSPSMHPYSLAPHLMSTPLKPNEKIRQSLGMMQMKIVIALLIKNYSFTINKKTKQPIRMLPFTIISKIEGGLWLDVRKV